MSGFSPGHPSDRAGGRTPEPVQERGQTGTGVSVGSKATGRVGSWGLGCPSGQGVEAEPKHFKPWEDVVLKNKMSMGPLFHGRGKTSVSLTPPPQRNSGWIHDLAVSVGGAMRRARQMGTTGQSAGEPPGARGRDPGLAAPIRCGPRDLAKATGPLRLLSSPVRRNNGGTTRTINELPAVSAAKMARLLRRELPLL